MLRSTPPVGAAGKVPGAEDQTELEPAWRPWIRLLDVVLKATDDPKWGAAVPELAHGEGGRPPKAPLLDGAVLRPDTRRLRRLVRELLAAAESAGGASLAGLRSRRLDRPALLAAAINRDAAAIEQVAGAAGVEADALEVVAQLATTPLLCACARRLHEHIPSSWAEGYCPICGAWPALAELRGLERNRRLRCGRCASDWPSPVLRCPFCDELQHDQLGSLLPEGEAQTRRIDTCATCKGYVKTFSTLRPMDLRLLMTEDLASVELDLAAQARGYARPSHPGYSLTVTVEQVTSLPALLGRWA